MMNTAKSGLLAAGALGLVLGAASAQENGPGPDDSGYGAPPPAQDYVPPPAYYGAGPENVIIIGPPRRRIDHSSLAPTEITKLSRNVAYGDLDLRTVGGALQLRGRIREAARDICGRLEARFPHALYDTSSCYEQAVQGGMNRADMAIFDARNYTEVTDRE